MRTNTMGVRRVGFPWVDLSRLGFATRDLDPHHPSVICPTIPGRTGKKGYAHPHSRYPHAASAKRRRAPVSIGSNVA